MRRSKSRGRPTRRWPSGSTTATSSTSSSRPSAWSTSSTTSSKKGFDLNLNIVIFLFFILGVILHRKPINYVQAVNIAIRSCGGIALQFPLYGGIMGMMIGTGLAKVIAGWFVAISSPETFYMFQFWAAGIINMFVPSGGGQWAVQGPITVEAAKLMNIDMVKSAMMVAWGDQWTNMIQPFWALPLLGLGGALRQGHHGLHDDDPPVVGRHPDVLCPAAWLRGHVIAD